MQGLSIIRKGGGGGGGGLGIFNLLVQRAGLNRNIMHKSECHDTGNSQRAGRER